jgi:predicted amidohydrolase
MEQKIKIAGVQMEPKIMEKEANLESCIELIRTTAKEDAKLIVFPECALTGYCYSSLEEALSYAETIPGPSTDTLIEVCRELDVYVVVGLLEMDGDKYYNAVALIGAEGLVGKYRKLHLPYLGIDRFLNHGDLPLTIYDTKIGRIGMGICYDVNFPEHSRILALKGADVVVLPTNWPEGIEFVPELIVPTRAIENNIFYVAINRVGDERGFKFFGGSRICHYFGIPLADGKKNEEDILYAEIEPLLAREKHIVLRPEEFEVHVNNDRRPEFYAPITDALMDTTRIR